MTHNEAHLLRYTRMAGELGQTPRDLFVLVNETEVSVCTHDAAVLIIFDGEFNPEHVLWVPFEDSVPRTLVRHTSGWFTQDGVTAVLTEGGEERQHSHGSGDPTDGGPGPESGEE